jgi:hypothetical protein
LTSADLTCPSPALTCFKNDKAITCLNNNYLLPDQTCAATCDSNKNPTYISGLTSAQNSGFCNNDCGSTNTCLHNFNNYNNNFSCIGNFTKLYLFCYKNEDKPKGAIHYGQYFNSPNFSYNVSPTLDNYLFEVWFYPDKRFITDSTDTNLLVLLTSGITIKKASLTAENDYMLYDSTGNALGSAFTLKFMNWYRLSFLVKKSGSTYSYSFFYNKYTNGYLQQSTSTNISLSSVTFCTTCSPSSNKWFSGFYKWMRIWKGDFITDSLYREMDKM